MKNLLTLQVEILNIVPFLSIRCYESLFKIIKSLVNFYLLLLVLNFINFTVESVYTLSINTNTQRKVSSE